jgi:hypothetical protein
MIGIRSLWFVGLSRVEKLAAQVGRRQQGKTGIWSRQSLDELEPLTCPGLLTIFASTWNGYICTYLVTFGHARSTPAHGTIYYLQGKRDNFVWLACIHET